MKVVVTGAAGFISLSTLMYLLKQDDVVQIIAADIQADKLSERVKSLGDQRLKAKSVDLRDVKASAALFEGNDIVINCSYQGYATDKEFIDYDQSGNTSKTRARTTVFLRLYRGSRRFFYPDTNVWRAELVWCLLQTDAE